MFKHTPHGANAECICTKLCCIHHPAIFVSLFSVFLSVAGEKQKWKQLNFVVWKEILANSHRAASSGESPMGCIRG